MILNFVKKHPAPAAFISFCLLFLCALPFNQHIFSKYFLDPSTKFDQGIYLNIARRGYEVSSETAFYPLWPLLVRLAQSFTPLEYQVQTGNLLSLVIFGISLSLIWSLARKITDESAATWTVFLFALNPNSIFHALSYPESVFSLFAAVFLHFTIQFFTEPQLKSAVGLLITACLMSASRPIILQFLSAAVCAIGIVWFIYHKKPDGQEFVNQSFRWLALSTAGLVAGYIPFGFYCADKFQDFFAPFSAQKNWDRKFGFYWSLLTSPKSVSNSDNMLTWDIQAFYLPSVLLAVFLYFHKKNKSIDRRLSSENCPDTTRSFVIFFSLFIAAAHSAIAFLTYPIFMSLARHVYSTPFFFLGGVAVLYSSMPPKHRIYLLRFYIFGSIVYLLNFWTRFGNSAWMG